MGRIERSQVVERPSGAIDHPADPALCSVLADYPLGAMEHLSPEHRAVVHLTYFHGIGYREIAEILACPVDTVKTRMFHARRRLKAALPGELAEWL